MVLFQTSSPGGYTRENGKLKSCGLNAANSFVDNLKKYWTGSGKMLFIAASPNEYDRNDEFSSVLAQSFGISGMPIFKKDVLDYRNTGFDPKEYDLVVLGGGHVPTQMAFFQEIQLHERLSDFQGIILGCSAGSMNSSHLVYAQPELLGEAIDPNYKRFHKGLGLTEHMIVPHFNMWNGDILDDLRLLEDITYPDSIGKTFYLLYDGSYILTEGSESHLFGEAYLVQDGQLHQVCQQGHSIQL